MKTKETLEETAENYKIKTIKSGRSHRVEYTKQIKLDFIAGAKWQQEQMFDIMQQFAAFCVKCDREKLPLLFAKEWFEQFNK